MKTFFFLLTLLGLPMQDDAVNEFIRAKSEQLVAEQPVTVQGELLRCQKMLPEFYQNRRFVAAWSKENRQAYLTVLSNVGQDGLNPADYHYSTLNRLVLEADTPLEIAELDLLLTDSFLLFASHFLNGKINPETVDSQWKAIRREGNARLVLEEALAQKSISTTLRSLAPKHEGYAGLKQTLARYRKIKANGGWVPVDAGDNLEIGVSDPTRTQQLVNRLVVTGDLATAPEDPTVYTEEVAAAVKRFQFRHGIDTLGHVGAQTLAALNVPVEARIQQLEINLERLRWIPQDLGQHYVFVNIASYQLEIYRGAEKSYQEIVIVGKPYRKTPVFSSKMTYMVINPYWTVPPTILFNDVLPEVQRNVGYLANKHIRVFRGQGSNAVEVDPTTVDWSKLSRNNFPYTLRQDPGTDNALGVVKFMFPNTYNVYIHDTPSKALFSQTERALSSGCIRIKNPLGLVDYLIQDDDRWDKTKINAVVKSGKETTILLREPLNVHLLYLTAWWRDGVAHFRKDPYDRDPAVLAALQEAAPSL